jgi:uncharacterized protein (TIGR03790 family)
MKNLWSVCGALAVAGCMSTSRAAGPGDEVVVVYNSRLPESKELAFYYAERRDVPTNQVFGFDLPTTETISRKEFRDQLQKPLLRALEKQGLFKVSSEIIPATRDRTGDVIQKLAAARVRYATLCYGVPVRILKDPGLSEPGVDKVREELRRNEAAVDSELAFLPVMWRNLPLFGPLNNPVYGATNAAIIHPTNGVLMVARLDGPSAQIARGLVDKAMEAETNGLWGRAYFDVRGLTNTNYRLGDDWIRSAANVVKLLGFETIMDEKPETFPAAFPMSQIGFYAGWYDGAVSGPFTLPKVEFMPGALAYHLHSFSAHTIRAPDRYWVGPLLAKGVTATMGCVDEPYLEGTPDVTALFSRFTALGFSFGEAAYAAQSTLSWQTTVVGDPLYRPFGRKSPGDHFGVRLRELHSELLARKSKLIEWSHLHVVNLNLVNGFPVSEVITYLEREPTTRGSSVLLEKLAEIYDSQGKLSDVIETYERALKQETSPQQRTRVMLTLARTLALYTREQPALDLYQRFVKEFPDYPDLLSVYQRMLPLAKELQKAADAEKIQEEIKRLQPAAAR